MGNGVISWMCIIFVSAYHIVNCNQQPPPASETANSANALAVIEAPFASCRILYNEFDLSTASNDAKFIELGKYCISPTRSTSFDLKRFSIIAVNVKGQIVANCKLKGAMTFRPTSNSQHRKSHWFFVLGGSQTKNVNMNIKECQISAAYGGDFPLSEEYPVAYILLYSKAEKTLDSLTMTPKGCTHNCGVQSNFIDSSRKETIIKYMQDIVIVGTVTPFISCNVFQKFYEKYTNNPQYVLRDWTTEDELGKSLSRCGSSTLPINPESYKFTIPTPGERNRCEFATILDVTALSLLTQNPKYVPILGAYGCDSSASFNARNEPQPLSVQELENVFNSNVDYEVEIELENEDYEDITIDYEDQELVENCDKDKVQTTFADDVDINDYKFDISSIDFTKKHMDENCENYMPHLSQIPSSDIDTSFIFNNNSICWWVEYQPPTATHTAKATCKLCNKLYSEGLLVDRPKSKENSKFVSEGDWSSDKDRKRRYNRNLIQHHIESKYHKISTQYYANIENGKRGKALFKEMMKKDEPFYKFFEATNNLALVVHTAVKMGLPFNQFGELMRTLRYIQGDTFGYVHHTKDGMANMLQVISDSYKMELLHHLRSTNPKIGIILDGSTDKAGYSNVAVLFQTWDGNNNPRPTTLHYTLTHLQYGEKGIGYFNVFTEQLERDKLTSLVKENTVSITADGASSMKFTFVANMKTFVNHPEKLLYSHCAAHRLNLALKTTTLKFEYFKYIDSKINKLHSFFGKKASKKRLLLRKNMKERSVKEFALGRIFDERWVATRNRAYSRILKHWKLVLETLEDILDSPKEFTADDRKNAMELKSDLVDPTFVLHVAFLVDITNEHVPVSLDFQRGNSSWIGKYSYVQKLKQKLATIAINGGPKLVEITDEIFHVDEANIPPDSMKEKVELIEIQLSEYKEVDLEPQKKNENRTLFKNWDEYNADVLAQLDKYFGPDELSNNFDVFDPEKFPTDLADNSNFNYGQLQLEKLNKYFAWHPLQRVLHNTFVQLVHSIVSHTEFLAKKKLVPEKFWHYYLGNSNVQWTSELKRMIRYVLTISPSSADAERTFSMVTATKTTGRYNLATEQVDKILRVKINGEKNIQRVNSVSYARQFIQKFCKADELGRKKPQATTIGDEHDANGIRYRTIFEKRYEDEN